jgi:hypothetical protein
VSVLARILIWNLYDSQTTLEELRARLPDPPEGAHWISNEAHEQFGVIAFGDEPPELGDLPALIGVEPAVAEEYDVE